MKYELSGTVMQTVGIDLAPGDVIYSQTAAMAWMTEGVSMNTNTGGGLFAGLKRSLTGGSLFITEFSTDRGGHVAFAPRFPGSILVRQLKDGESLICRKETFLCAERAVGLELAWQQRIGAGFFGGAGFILQKITGPGTVFLDLSGEVVTKQLGAGEKQQVHAGHDGVHEPTVSFDIQMLPGFSNVLFGGEASFYGHAHRSRRSAPAVDARAAAGRRDRPLPAPPGSRTPMCPPASQAGGAIGGILGSILSGNN